MDLRPRFKTQHGRNGFPDFNPPATRRCIEKIHEETEDTVDNPCISWATLSKSLYIPSRKTAQQADSR